VKDETICCTVRITGNPNKGKLFWEVIVGDAKGNRSGDRRGTSKSFVDAAGEAFEAASRLGSNHVRQRRRRLPEVKD
jgi:hypothetical protein